MESLDPRLLFESGDTAVVEANIKYVTSIYSYDHTLKVELVKENGHWLVDNDLSEYDQSASNQIISSANVSWLGVQGSSETKSDVEKLTNKISRPSLRIEQINLISLSNKFFVTGLISNAGSLPVFLTTSAYLSYFSQPQLFNNAQIMQKHFLMPHEETFFRIDFDPVAGFDLNSLTDVSSYFFKRYIEAEIQKFSVNAKAIFLPTVKFNRLDYRVDSFDESQNIVNLEISNNTLNQATVPQVTFALLDENQQIVFVGQQFVNHAINQNSKQSVALKIPNFETFEISDKKIDAVSINGSKNSILFSSPKNLIRLPDGLKWKYLKVQTNFFNEG